MKNTIPLKRSRAIIHLKRGMPVVSVGEPISRTTIEKTRCELQRDRTKKILGRFAQAEGHKKGGSGLGLAISKAIVERHGGRIGFTTEKGTAFFFELPELTS